MSLRSARPVDENLSELAEHGAADEQATSRENGEEAQTLWVNASGASRTDGGLWYVINAWG